MKGVLFGTVAMAMTMVGCALSKNSSATGTGKKLIGAKLSIKHDKVDDFIKAAKTIIAASRAEPGCISYTLYQDPYDKAAFFFFEEWKDQTAIDAHFAMPHFKAFGPSIKDLVAGAPSITIYSALSENKP